MKEKGKSLKVTSPGVTFIKRKGDTSGEYKLSGEEIVQDEPVRAPSSSRKTMGVELPPKSGKFPRW
jgi:hypothetical protein